MAYQPKHVKQKKTGGIFSLWNLAILLFGGMMVLAVAMLLSNTLESRQDQDAFRELAAMVEAQTEPASVQPVTDSRPQPAPEGEKPAEETQPEVSPYQILHEQNPDFVAWLTVPGTVIDYPVMHTPGDIEHYIYRAFDGSDSPSGTPFVGDYGSLDSQRCIIYGHNMGDGTMFRDLLKYMDPDFWRENPTFTVHTLTGTREYEIFAAVQTRILYPEEQGQRFYHLEDGVEQWLLKRSLYDTGIQPTEEDTILLLSTCSYHTEDGRFVVAGRLVK